MFTDKLKNIRAFILDIDGVLTDGTIHVTETGEQLRRFNVKDGYAIQLAIKKGFYVCAISGGKSESVSLRLKTLGIIDIYLGIDTKVDIYNEIVNKYNLRADQVLYMGDDLPDIPVMKLAGIAVCPIDAAEEVKNVSHFISAKSGGTGCVREIISQVLKIQDKWYNENEMTFENVTST